MGPVIRGLRNVFRSPVRTVLVVTLLAVSIGLAVSMLAVNGAVGERLQEVNQQLTPEITLRPAGSFGFFGGGEPLLATDLAPIESMENVVALYKTAMTQYSGDALESAVDAGTLGRRFFGGRGGFGGSQGIAPAAGEDATVNIPIIIMGNDGGGQVSLFGGGTVEMTAGRNLAPEDSGSSVAIMGEALAEKNGLQVGSTLEIIEGSPVEIVGLFSSGQSFGDNMMAMPFDTLQVLFDLGGEVTQATVVVETVDQVGATAGAIEDIVGTERVDVLTEADRLTQVNGALEGASGSTRTGTLASLGAAAAIIFFAVAMMVRERRREIGVLKAIGASNRQVVVQFAMESGAIAVIAVVLALGVAMIAIQPVADQVLASDDTPQVVGQFGRFGPAAGGQQNRPSAFRGRQSGGFFGGVGNLEAGLTPGSALTAGFSGVALSLGAAFVASLFIARVRPAEVLRGE